MIKAKEATIKVQSLAEFFKESRKEAKEIDAGIFKPAKFVLTFTSARLMKKFLTEQRLRLLKTIRIKKPQSIYELAKISKRQMKSINRDVQILEELGLIELKKQNGSRHRVCPKLLYDKINIAIEI